MDSFRATDEPPIIKQTREPLEDPTEEQITNAESIRKRTVEDYACNTEGIDVGRGINPDAFFTITDPTKPEGHNGGHPTDCELTLVASVFWLVVTRE